MTSERSVGVVWSEETENGVTLHMRVGTGADVMLTLPNASVAAQAEAQLRSVLAMATMQFQRVAKETTSGGTLWEGFMPEETKAHIAEQAEALVKTISDGRLDRPLLSAVASFLHYPAMASLSRLAYLVKAIHAALNGRRGEAGP
jgi:hypothetical protein